MKSRNLFLIAIALAGASAILPAEAVAAEPRTQPLVVAHRGGAALMPENTFPAFDHALALGAQVLEFDMVMTADDQIVVQHDPTVNASFCSADPASGVAPGPVRSLTLAQLLTFDCGARHRAIYPNQKAVPGTPMPTLTALLDRYKSADALLFGEIKMPGAGEGEVDPVAFAGQLEGQIRKAGLEERFILQSSDWRAIDAMHAINPRIRTCLLGVWRAQKDLLQTAREHHATCMLLRLKDADAAEVKRLQAAGVMVVSEVIDAEPDWGRYRARGDDALFTNDPAGLIAYLNRPAEAAIAPDQLWRSAPASKVIVLAHRGCWREAPEVSIAAIRACGPIGADAVEVDVRVSSDGVLVLMHDETVDRTTNVTGAVASLTAAQIRALRLRAGAGGPTAPLTDEHPPTLEEALEAARGKIAVNLHLKAPVEAQVAAMLQRMGMTAQTTTWVPGPPDADLLAQSPLPGAIGLIPTINECSRHHTAPCWSAPVRSLSQFAPYKPVAFFFDWMTSRAFIRQIATADRPASSRLFVETLNTIDHLPQPDRHREWRDLIDMGVTVIMTDEPADLVRLLREAPSQ